MKIYKSFEKKINQELIINSEREKDSNNEPEIYEFHYYYLKSNGTNKWCNKVQGLQVELSHTLCCKECSISAYFVFKISAKPETNGI